MLGKSENGTTFVYEISDTYAEVLFFYPNINGVGVCEVSLGYSTDRAADEAFEKLDVSIIEAGILPQIKHIRASFGRLWNER